MIVELGESRPWFYMMGFNKFSLRMSQNQTAFIFILNDQGLILPTIFFGIWIKFLIFYEAGTSDRNRLTE